MTDRDRSSTVGSAVADDTLVTMECEIPEQWRPGQKIFWTSPTGHRVGLSVPPGLGPGEQLEFAVPERLISGPPAEAPPAAAPGRERMQVLVPAEWTPGQKLTVAVDGGSRKIFIEPPAGAIAGQTVVEFEVPDAPPPAPAAAPSQVMAAAGVEEAPPPAPPNPFDAVDVRKSTPARADAFFEAELRQSVSGAAAAALLTSLQTEPGGGPAATVESAEEAAARAAAGEAAAAAGEPGQVPAPQAPAAGPIVLPAKKQRT